MTIVFDHYMIPETGTFEIRQTVTVNISATDAQRKVDQWLVMKVSSQMGTAEPVLAINDKTVWRIPVRFTAPHVGTVGIVGSVNVDALTGELLFLDRCKQIIEQKAEELTETIPPFKPHTYVPEEYIPQGIPPASRLVINNDGEVVPATPVPA